MNKNQAHKGNRVSKRIFSPEEKRNYCMAWETSGMSQIAFCKARGISTSALYQWNKAFKKEKDDPGFSPLVSEKQPSIKPADILQLTIGFPNQMQLTVAMPEPRLVSFIQELGYATAIIR